ncbi:tumor susceptibility protein 101 [Pyrenophora tritici-repentis]|uniref:Cell division protein n=2 Tax=Pyrenophora tritici-repentis TaxID=45151 RepID=A0A2W1E335_9PLEO|nr:ZipA Cell division protein [Pyrenophora tritici-repentis]KAF7451125.1 ZipA Cell division protein [Pyrenophora tritici-repentis]KAF7573811.1 ZipA, Cell division protein [Pyrenophora tritici-repentis]KAG9380664.1 ZipA Cell division protein [Pyrenophora tritici-repentis]KAI0571059.1 ZipA Cell division protein [Pyrenophora tritici-repentis]
MSQAVPDKVLNWLYSVLLAEYLDVNRTYHDAAETLSAHASLSPKTELYTYENGASALLLLLTGTLPVTFRGATYGFPVAIWVPHDYPREPPMVYVTPSHDMVLRPGQHVSTDGRVYHPYLAQWAKYWDKSTLFDFLAVLRGVFSKEPPVRSRQQQPQYNTPAQQAPPPVPPPPEEWRRSVHSASGASPSPAHPGQPPAPPPKPPKPHEQSQHTPQPPHDRYSQPPPLPPHIPQPQPFHHLQRNTWQELPLGQQYAPSRQGSYDISPATPVSRHQHPQAQGYPQQTVDLGSPVSPIVADGHRAGFQKSAPPQPPGFQHVQQHQGPPVPQQQQQQYGGPPPPHQQYQQPPQGYPPQQHPQYQQYPQQQAPPAPKPPVDLLDDSLEVTLPSQSENQIPLPVPPVPPNPEKDALLQALSQTLVSQIQQTVASNTAAVAPLRAQQAALQNAYSRLQAELGELQQLDAALASNEQVLKGAMIEADRVMEDARRRKAPDVDDVLVAPTVVGGQLYTLAAEERGISDALFVLGRALDKGRISTDVFVKQTRSLAREQFLKKALIKKIAKGMALDEYQMR